MGEQEKYKKMLKEVIDETESRKINSAEELIQKLVRELTSNKVLSQRTQS
ncbi:hypothetical protein [Oceanobacillus bengalensis]|nr:hypothetical protein [Oceanobacillus bengalensis]